MSNNYLADIIKQRHENTVLAALGISVDKLDADQTIVSLSVDKRHLQHMGIVHGGVYVLLLETAASLAGACTLTHEAQRVVALEINANHVHSVSSGRLIARSRQIHAGKKTLVYEAKVTNDEEKLISIARCTLMIINPN